MLISYIAFTRIFGYHPFPVSKDAPISDSTERLMGPDFKTLRDSGIDAKDELLKKTSQKLEITSGDGLKLRAVLFNADKPTDRYIILVHGHNSHGMKDNALKALGYIKEDFNVLLPDNRACGNSEGKWETFGAKESDDILLWVDKLIELQPECKIAVDGCSMGGATVCMLLAKPLPKNVKFLVSDCAFVSAEEEFKFMFKKFAHLPTFPLFYTINIWNKIINHLSYKDSMPIEAVAKAKIPMLFFHGKEDRYIPCENAKRLYDKCPTDKHLTLIDGAGHAASCVKGKESYFNHVFDFAAKYM